jgi:homoprotocatechuate degradation regulator HpaR
MSQPPHEGAPESKGRVRPGAAPSPATGPRATAAPPAIPHRNLPLLLLHAREAVLARFRPILKDHGLTEQQWRIVRALVEDGPLEPRQIVERCRISSPSLAGVLARMEEQGLVGRSAHATDRRRQTVEASSRSRTLARTIAPRIEATYRELEAEFDPAFVDRLYGALDRLLEQLDGGHAGTAGPDIAVTPSTVDDARSDRPDTARATDA